MQGAIARVCMVVAAAILNHPLLFPQENTTLLEQDEELLVRMKEHEERLELEQMRLEKELSHPDVEEQNLDSGESYSWYFWSTLSLVIFFTIEVCRQDLADMEAQYLEDEDMDAETGFISSKTLLLDKGILSSFCDRCMHTMAHENWRVKEFVEGFADDLLEALRSVCGREADMEVGDFVGVGSMFESWRASKPLMCDLIVPFTPPEPNSFQFKLWCSPSSYVPPDMQGCGRIKVSRAGENKEDCLCGSANFGEDMLCLLHRNTERPKADQTSEDLLCSKNTVYLAKDQVMKWFQISVTKAWGRISHKYEFQLTFRNLETAGALKIRFRSGKVVVMNIIPVVQLEDTSAYFVPHFPSDGTSFSDTYWPLSFAVYERNFLKHVAKGLPENACHLHCLQILTFLLKKQTGLTGRSFLTNYHLKTAVLHLLLCRASSCWGPGCLELRLRDVLGFLQRSLQQKRLHHVLVGNSLVPTVIQVPEIFSRSEPINLFRSLVLHKELYAHTLRHFQEMLRNAPVLIQEYTPVLPNGDVHHGLDSSS
ncbi:inositol 1,4,5-trisphosphate receptor-interacting protein [Osmerus mordax]|uniref:inositol 1,4,5-trisphosphate receptor-interacting protein n=1 Tax=Osmerus mordax TaxID=8014 RepID=UPI00350F5E4F